MSETCKLSVNINKIATLRNARGGSIPDVILAAQRCQEYGAQGITVHPRPDERHITYKDVRELRGVVHTEFNIEGYPSEDFLALAEEVKPEQVTLVPDPPGVLTSNAGWKVSENLDFLKEVISRLKSQGMRVSIFMETDKKEIELASDTGTDRIELYTEDYARTYPTDPETAVRAYKEAAQLAHQLGMGVNAGHDLDLNNLKNFNEQIPELLEVSIGHALISDALYFGLQNTIQLYLRALRP